MTRLAAVFVALVAVPPVAAQTARSALVAGAARYSLADYPGAAPLLAAGLDPAAAPRDSLWLRGVERLADVLLVLREDSLAAIWLRWAIRLSPEFEVDADVMPPTVVRATAAARAFVDSTPHDRFVSRVAFDWRAAFRGGRTGSVRLAAASVPITARVGADQFLRDGESRSMAPGSYGIVVSAPGYLPTRLTVEVLPGITTSISVQLLPETAGVLSVAARPWGTLFVDGNQVGFTPVAGHRLPPGPHTLRLERQVGAPAETTVVIGEREQIHISWVASPHVSGDAAVDRALEQLDAGRVERGLEAIEQVLSSEARPGPIAAQALARLAEAGWALTNGRAAQPYLRRLVEADPFFVPPLDLFNPELRTAYWEVRRETPAVAVRTASDTIIRPFRDRLPVELAVGQPGMVRLLLRLTAPEPRDSLMLVVPVESTATVALALDRPDSSVLADGVYALEAEVSLPSGAVSALLVLSVQRERADTLPHEPPLMPHGFLPESRTAFPARRAVTQSIWMGIAALVVPVVIHNGDLAGRAVPPAAILLGGSVAVVNLAFNTRQVPIPENIAQNQALRARWGERDRTIAAQNAALLRRTPIAVRSRGAR